MKSFTVERTSNTPDTVWFRQHLPVFTQGLNGKPEHILQSSNIPIVQTDRGGQITYHGPGQLMVYVLFDLKRHRISPRALVQTLEQIVIDLLADYDINAHSDHTAPGVYVEKEKIASIGLRVKRGFSYHGMALNVDTDLTPFQLINPCGYPQLKMTQMIDHLHVTLETPLICKQLEQKLREIPLKIDCVFLAGSYN